MFRTVAERNDWCCDQQDSPETRGGTGNDIKEEEGNRRLGGVLDRRTVLRLRQPPSRSRALLWSPLHAATTLPSHAAFNMTPPLTVQTRRLAAITSQLVPTPSSRPPSVNPDDPASSERIRIINEAHRAPPQEVQLPRRAPDMSMGGAARPGMMVGGMEMQGRWGNQREYSTAASGRPAGSGGSGPSAGGKQPSPWTEEARYGYWLPIQTRWQDNDQCKSFSLLPASAPLT